MSLCGAFELTAALIGKPSGALRLLQILVQNHSVTRLPSLSISLNRFQFVIYLYEIFVYC